MDSVGDLQFAHQAAGLQAGFGQAAAQRQMIRAEHAAGKADAQVVAGAELGVPGQAQAAEGLPGAVYSPARSAGWRTGAGRRSGSCRERRVLAGSAVTLA